MDSLGNELAIREGGSIGWYDVEGDNLFEPVDSRATELTITPYIRLPKQGEWGIGEPDGDGIRSFIDMTPYEGKDFVFDSFTVKLP